MDKSDGCCAHLNVVYAPEFDADNKHYRERWVCEKCGAEFRRCNSVLEEKQRRAREVSNG